MEADRTHSGSFGRSSLQCSSWVGQETTKCKKRADKKCCVTWRKVQLAWQPMWASMHALQVDAIIKLVAAGANPNTVRPATGGTPLHEAAFTGQAGAIRELVAAGANIFTKRLNGCSPLHEAVWQGQVAAIKWVPAALSLGLILVVQA